ncbi:hypothetical protein VTN96DRAFT_8562 [Rasamsonia emersonii]
MAPLKDVVAVKEDDTICQLLWSPANDLLLASNKNGTTIWSAQGNKKACCETGPSYYWFNHPFERSCIVGFTHDHIGISLWSDLTTVKKATLDLSALDKGRRDTLVEYGAMSPLSLTKVLITPDAKYALLEISTRSAKRRRRDKHFFWFVMADLFDMKKQSVLKSINDLRISPVWLQHSPFPRIEVPLGFLPTDTSPRHHWSPSLQTTSSTVDRRKRQIELFNYCLI